MAMNSYSEFSRKLREQYGLTQRELGDLLGIDDSTVSNAESGRRPFPIAARRLLWVMSVFPDVLPKLRAEMERLNRRAKEVG